MQLYVAHTVYLSHLVPVKPLGSYSNLSTPKDNELPCQEQTSHHFFCHYRVWHTFSTGCTYIYSQNDRMTGVGSDLWRSPCPTPAQVGPLTTSCPGRHQMAFEYLQGERLHTLSRQPRSVSGHPHRKIWPFFILCLNRTPCTPFCASQPVTAEYRQKKKTKHIHRGWQC